MHGNKLAVAGGSTSHPGWIVVLTGQNRDPFMIHASHTSQLARFGRAKTLNSLNHVDGVSDVV